MTDHRVLAGRLGALKVHAEGKTNTAPARDAFLARFEAQVDPDGSLSPAERSRRAAFARRAYMTQLSLRSARSRMTRAQKESAKGPRP